MDPNQLAELDLHCFKREHVEFWDSINRHVDIIKDFQSCVCKNLWNVQYGSIMHGKLIRKTYYSNSVQPFNKHMRDSPRFCWQDIL